MKKEIIILLGILVLLTACQKAVTEQPVAANTVEIKDFAFGHSNLEIAKGTTITWTNKDSYPHTVTFDDGSADLKVGPGESVTRTFDAAGDFAYHCAIRPSMKAAVSVK